MDAMDKELDKLLLMIERMPDGEMRDKLIERYNGYRNKFEENAQAISAVSPLGLEILKFEVDVQAYVSGMSSVDPLKDYHILQPISTGKKEERQKDTKEIENILVDILNSKISTGDIDALKGIIKDVQKEYKGLSSKNQELDLKIAESEYVLMKGLLKNGRVEEATDLTKQFDTDMSIFLLRRLSPKVDELRSNGRLQDALFLAKYCKDGEPRETDLKFWERIVNIEEPELDYKLPENDNEQVKDELKKEGLITRVKKRIEQAKADREQKRESNVRVMHIRYDPQSDFHHMNKEDCEKVKQAITLKDAKKHKESNIKVVFDEGITEIAFPDVQESSCSLEIEFGIRASYLREVQIPSTAQRICRNAFSGCDNLQQINLSNTKIKTIEPYAFACSGISSIIFPDCLETISDCAFKRCSNLKVVDLSNTCIKTIGPCAFGGEYALSPDGYVPLKSGVEEVALPQSLEELWYSSFQICPLKKVLIPKKCEECFTNRLYKDKFPSEPIIEFIDDGITSDIELNEKLKMIKSGNLRNEALRLIEATIEPEVSNDVKHEH